MAVILFVEDDAVSRRSIANFLRLSGYEVHEAENGEAALKLLSTMHFDVVISDLNLPGKLNGIDILDALKTITRRIKAILITGRGSEEIKSKANSLGALYLEKPVQLQELETALEWRDASYPIEGSPARALLIHGIAPTSRTQAIDRRASVIACTEASGKPRSSLYALWQCRHDPRLHRITSVGCRARFRPVQPPAYE